MLKLPTRLWPHGQKWAEYNELVPAGTPLSAVMTRDYWIHIQNQMRPLDVINCVAEDGTFDVTIRLLSKTSTELRFRLIREAKIDVAVAISREEATDRFRVVSGGRAGGWRVQERATGQIIADGLDKAAAEAEKARLETERKAA
jgi:hypothetical protein